MAFDEKSINLCHKGETVPDTVVLKTGKRHPDMVFLSGKTVSVSIEAFYKDPFETQKLFLRVNTLNSSFKGKEISIVIAYLKVCPYSFSRLHLEIQILVIRQSISSDHVVFSLWVKINQSPFCSGKQFLSPEFFFKFLPLLIS